MQGVAVNRMGVWGFTIPKSYENFRTIVLVIVQASTLHGENIQGIKMGTPNRERQDCGGNVTGM